MCVGVGNLMWDILASLGSRPKDSEQGDDMTRSLLLLGHPGVGAQPCLICIISVHSYASP